MSDPQDMIELEGKLDRANRLIKCYSILRHFSWSHLRGDLQTVSRPICEFAFDMADILPHCEETLAGLRKLLEGKDCLVRAKLEEMDNG